MKVLFALLVLLGFISCASSRMHVIESDLISEMEKNCRTVEVKRDYDQGVYVIEYTGKISKNRCPSALIKGWKDGSVIEKEVEICGCRNEKGK